MSRGDRRINAKSIMGVMMLAAGIGTEVEMETSGEREKEAIGRAAGADCRQVWRGEDPAQVRQRRRRSRTQETAE